MQVAPLDDQTVTGLVASRPRAMVVILIVYCNIAGAVLHTRVFQAPL